MDCQKDKDREQGRALQREKKGTGRQDKGKDRQKEETGSRGQMEGKKPGLGSRTERWRREKTAHFLQKYIGVLQLLEYDAS